MNDFWKNCFKKSSKKNICRFPILLLFFQRFRFFQNIIEKKNRKIILLILLKVWKVTVDNATYLDILVKPELQVIWNWIYPYLEHNPNLDLNPDINLNSDLDLNPDLDFNPDLDLNPDIKNMIEQLLNCANMSYTTLIQDLQEAIDLVKF